MATAKKCGAKIETEDGRTLECVLKPGAANHPDDVHDDGNGEWWGDSLEHLSTPPVEDPERDLAEINPLY